MHVINLNNLQILLLISRLEMNLIDYRVVTSLNMITLITCQVHMEVLQLGYDNSFL